ncbi:MAG TPA: DUF4388 domain-containing protein [Chloroflexia bacterium]|nr:DUF4388 domain-containing protein [Chloroflexia bacterium]
MALEGNLEEFNIVAVLQVLGSGAMTGRLVVREAINKATVTFVQGQIIHAESTHEADRIGEILVRTHRITRAQLEKATSVQMRQHSGTRLGQVLRDMRLVAEDDLAMAVQIQILETMSRLLLWRRGHWHFQFEAFDPATGIPAGAMTVDEIVSGQIVLLDNMDPLFNKDDMLDEVYSIVPGRNKDSERIILESKDWTVLSAIDGRSTVRQIADRLRLDAEDTCHIVVDLLAVHLVARSEAPLPPREDATLAGFPLESAPTSIVPVPGTVVINTADAGRLNAVLEVLLARAEAEEVCLIDSSGSLMARQGGNIHHNYPSLFALAASIFASWQELARTLGESKASTLLYQGAGRNVCLSPVGTRAILMTLYQQTSRSGLVNFWSREASSRLLRVLEAGNGSGPRPVAGVAPPTKPAGPPQAPGSNGGTVRPLDGAFRDEMARTMEELFRS